MTIRTLIVDDEPLARERIRTLLETDVEVEIVGECGDGRSAAAAILESDPDLVFLDVQMPEMDGFAALEAVRGRSAPVVVFVTAYDEYALKAFEVHALDYLLKPFDRPRFLSALGRAKRRVRADRDGGLAEGIERMLEEVRASGPDRWLEQLVVKSRGRIFFVRTEEIERVTAAGNYVELHVGGASHLIRGTMKGLERRLDPSRFARVHRSHIVNLRRIREIHPWFNGDYRIVLAGGDEITTGAAYRERMRQVLDNPI
jgi:two-component system LytT family response regulator